MGRGCASSWEVGRWWGRHSRGHGETPRPVQRAELETWDGPRVLGEGSPHRTGIFCEVRRPRPPVGRGAAKPERTGPRAPSARKVRGPEVLRVPLCPGGRWPTAGAEALVGAGAGPGHLGVRRGGAPARSAQDPASQCRGVVGIPGVATSDQAKVPLPWGRAGRGLGLARAEPPMTAGDSEVLPAHDGDPGACSTHPVQPRLCPWKLREAPLASPWQPAWPGAPAPRLGPAWHRPGVRGCRKDGPCDQ